MYKKTATLFLVVILLVTPMTFATAFTENLVTTEIISNQNNNLGAFGKITPIEKTEIKTVTEKINLKAGFEGANGSYEAVVVVGREAEIVLGANETATIIDEPSTEASDGNNTIIIPYIYDNSSIIAGIIINNNDINTTSTTVTLNLTFSDNLFGIKECRYANEDLNWTSWEGCVLAKSWNLSSGNGTKTVYYEVKNYQNFSKIVSDSINLTIPPELGNFSITPKYVKDGDLVNFDYINGGLGHNVVVNNTTELNKLDSTASTDLILLDNDNDGNYYNNYTISLSNTNLDGNYTLLATVDTLFILSDWIILDNTLPNASIVINNNDSVTTLPNVVLNLNYSDNFGVDQCRYRNENGNWTLWESCTPTKAWLLSNGNGLKTVYYEVRDLAGNINNASDDIILNITTTQIIITSPTAGSLVSGVVTINFTNIINRPEISVDGGNWINTTGLNYHIWDTTLIPDGSHIILIRDTNDSINYIYSPLTNFIVSNIPGTLIAVPDTVKNNDNISFIYHGENLGFVVTLYTTPLSDTVLSIPLTDIDRDVLYTGNLIVNKLGDEIKLLNASVVDNIGNVKYVYVNVTLDNTPPTASIVINNDSELTNLRIVNLNLNYSDNFAIDQCRYSNEDLIWSSWESCNIVKVWQLTEPDGNKTVFYQVKDKAGHTTEANDTIYLNKSAIIGIIDQTPPENLTVWDDGNYTNKNNTLHARWYAFDRESKVFYKYRIRENNINGTIIYPTNGSYVDAPNFGLAEEATVTNLSLSEGETYYFDVIAENSYFVSTNASFSDGIITDFHGPDAPVISSPTHTENDWENDNSPIFNWTEPDDNGYNSGIRGYSYVLDTNPDTIPDEIPEGDPQNLSAVRSATYTNIIDGTLYFHVRAQDNAENWGATDHYKIMVDTSPPTVPIITNPLILSNSTTITINFIPSVDYESGVQEYELVANDSDGNTINKTFVNSGSNSTTLNVNNGIIYFVKMRAKNYAGLYSLWSNEVGAIADIIPPEITFIKPVGLVVVNQPILVLETDELAFCNYTIGINSYPFDFTGSIYHEARTRPLNQTTYTVDFICRDLVGNRETASTTFTVNLGAEQVNSIALNTTGPYYEGGIVRFTAKIGNSSGDGLGEIQRSWFNIELDNKSLKSYALNDRGDGNYWILFDAPTRGIHNLTVKVVNVEDTESFIVNPLALEVKYAGSILNVTAEDKLLYGQGDNVIIGFGSDSKEVTIDPTNQNLTSGAADGTLYIFVTKPDAKVTGREKYLKSKQFNDLINPSFGYTIEKDTYTLNTELNYEDIVISGDRQIQSGRYNILIKNSGLTPEGKINITIQII